MENPEFQPAPPSEHVVAYYNPAGSQAEKAYGYAAEVQKLLGRSGAQVEIYETEPDAAGNLESFDAALEEKTAVIGFSGDGGQRNLFEGMRQFRKLHPENENVITAGLGGNACDLAHKLHDGTHLKNPARIFTDNAKTSIGHLPSIIVSAWPPGEDIPEEFRAFSYFGINLSGRINETLNSAAHKKEAGARRTELGRMSLEAQVITKQLHETPYVMIGEPSERDQAVELMALNSGLVAKMLRVKLDPFDQEARMCRINNPTVRSLGAAVLRASYHPDLRLHPGDETSYQLFSTDGSHEIPTQTDGDDTRYPSGTAFTIALSELNDTVPVLTTRHASPQK
jgi:hypothetical protein